ncbi:Galactose oxidase, beta-propeller [Corchorus capsularis]|uniref:Galactose oxidase, beta-propeller n=1 Tax=Corchorus capsularis TaxID=210143 RepID=A0A1R3H674_COCAP|nr:Galactose oxidase, beta-propeller [Corchorus capsularis]
MDRADPVSPPAEKQKNLVPGDVLIRASNLDDGKVLFGWYILNVEEGTIISTLMRMPPEARGGSTAVACSNQIYVLGGFCNLDPTCPDGKPSIFKNLGRWKSLSPPPPPLVEGSKSYPVVLDSALRRILVHFKSNDSLYAYYVDKNNWRLLKGGFGGWTKSVSSVIVDNVLYTLSTYGGRDFFFFPQSDETSLLLLAAYDWGIDLSKKPTSSLVAYDLAENKPLPTRWLSRFKGYAPGTTHLVHTGGSNLCLVWHSVSRHSLEYIRFRVTRVSGEVHAIGESESETSPIEANVCQISLL